MMIEELSFYWLRETPENFNLNNRFLSLSTARDLCLRARVFKAWEEFATVFDKEDQRGEQQFEECRDHPSKHEYQNSFRSNFASRTENLYM